MPERKYDIPQPVGLALVICDNVYVESGGKKALVGLFNRILATKFPAQHSRMCVYVSITDVRPNTTCRLDIVHAETDKSVIELRGPTPQEVGPTVIWDVVFQLENIVFPEPGMYFIRFFGNERIVLQRPIEVAALPEGSSEDE